MKEELKTLYLVFQGDVDEDNGRDRWTSAGVSSEEQYKPVSNTFDGDRSTFWKSGATGSMPQWFAVNMQGFKRISGFTWVNCVDPTQPAVPKHVKFETSMNGREWSEALDILELDPSRAMQVLKLDRTIAAKFFRVTVVSNWADAPYTYVAEVDIFSGDAPEAEQDVEKHKWRIVASHADWNADWQASRAIDGNPNTAWHTHLEGDYPYWFIIDFNKTLKIGGILFQNRLADPGATNFPKHVKWETSSDKVKWTTILELDELPNIENEQALPCTNVTNARYLKFTVYDGWTGGNWTFVGEMGIY